MSDTPDTSVPEPIDPIYVHYDAICAMQVEVDKLAENYDRKKEAAKAAKGVLEDAEAELRALIRRGPEPQRELPLEPRTQDAWRELGIGELELPPKIAEKLQQTDCQTLGDLADRMNAGEQWWREIEGFGEKTAEKVNEAFAAFWERHPEYAETDSDKEVADAEDAGDD